MRANHFALCHIRWLEARCSLGYAAGHMVKGPRIGIAAHVGIIAHAESPLAVNLCSPESSLQLGLASGRWENLEKKKKTGRENRAQSRPCSQTIRRRLCGTGSALSNQVS